MKMQMRKIPNLKKYLSHKPGDPSFITRTHTYMYTHRDRHYKLTSTPELLTLAAYVSKDDLVGHHWKERPIGLANFICPSTGECQGQKGVGRGLGVCVWGTFGIALEM